MHLPKALRRYVAGTVAVLFLACQGMTFAYARSLLGAPQSSTATAQESCHDLGQKSGANDNANKCLTQCQSQNTSSAQSGVNVLATTDLPAITTSIDRIVAVADSAPPAEPPLLRIESPPLRTLHCCLRN